MDKIEYNVGLLKRLVCGTINGKPYVLLDDAEYIVRNSGITEENTSNSSIKNLIDIRSAKWPEYYDECDAKDYFEWYIKGTNIKIAFDYIDGETGEHCYYKVICDNYDSMEAYDTEEQLLFDLQYILMNKNYSWRYYE